MPVDLVRERLVIRGGSQQLSDFLCFSHKEAARAEHLGVRQAKSSQRSCLKSEGEIRITGHGGQDDRSREAHLSY